MIHTRVEIERIDGPLWTALFKLAHYSFHVLPYSVLAAGKAARNMINAWPRPAWLSKAARKGRLKVNSTLIATTMRAVQPNRGLCVYAKEALEFRNVSQ